ncbi:peptidase inhibitor family I36 protein [Streptomyces sp. NPDC018972]|uniref:peptidase inhibitor family I36 protein n=1 Tax=Streptomyces sp. NPDC018972 TaxID=3365060 RepID=UPI0037BC60BD
MRVRKSLGVAIAALSVVGATQVTAAAAASGENGIQAKSACPSGWFRVRPKADHQGTMQKVRYDNADLFQHGGAFENGVVSVYDNGDSCDVAVYAHTDHRGHGGTLKRGASVASMPSTPIGSNDWVDCR